MVGPDGSINVRQEGSEKLAINVKESWRKGRRDWIIVVHRPIRREKIQEEEEKEKGEKEGCVLYRTFICGMMQTIQVGEEYWNITKSWTFHLPLVFLIFVTHLISYACHEKRGVFFLYVCGELLFIQRCSAESSLWRTNSKAIGLFTPRSVHPLPGARLALTRELQSDRLMRLQTVHFAFFCFITDVNA